MVGKGSCFLMGIDRGSCLQDESSQDLVHNNVNILNVLNCILKSG